MFIDFISRILGAEKVSVSNRLENDAEPSVIVTKDSNRPIPEKYRNPGYSPYALITVKTGA